MIVDSMPTPFHSWRNVAHPRRSDLKLRLSRIWWWSSFAVVAKSITRLTKVRPGFTTLPACCRCPIRGSSSLLVHDFLPCHDFIRDCRLCSLSAGRRSSIVAVSSSMPRNGSTVLGPSSLSSAKGTPSLLHDAIAVVKASAHWFVPGCPKKMKSSK